MDIGDDHWELYRDYYRDPFHHSLLKHQTEEVHGTVQEPY